MYGGEHPRDTQCGRRVANPGGEHPRDGQCGGRVVLPNIEIGPAGMVEDSPPRQVDRRLEAVERFSIADTVAEGDGNDLNDNSLLIPGTPLESPLGPGRKRLFSSQVSSAGCQGKAQYWTWEIPQSS